MHTQLFRCPRSGQTLLQKNATFASNDGQHTYPLADGIPDFYIEDTESQTPPNDADLKWLDAQAVEGRNSYYERCREWEGMSFCVDLITKLSHPECRILEVGAGTGHFSRWLADRCKTGTQIYAFDYSLPCLNTARTQIGAHQAVTLFRANARGAMPTAPNSFDLILQRLAPFAPKGSSPEAKTRRVMDLLKPGGYFIFAGWEDEYDGSCDGLIRSGFTRAAHYRWAYPYQFEEAEYIGGLIEGGSSRVGAESQMTNLRGSTESLTRIRKKHCFVAQKPD